MDRGSISRRYATALYRYARKHAVEECIYKATVTLSSSYMRYPPLRRTLANPVLPGEQKEKLITLAAGGDICDEFLHFIRLVIKQKREDSLQMICLSYQGIYHREKKRLHVDIITAIPIDKKTEKDIIDKLERMTHSIVSTETTIDPEIIGGYVMRWDTYRRDTSIASRLRQIKTDLKERTKIV